MTKQFELTEENNPNVMRIRAETGQLAVMSDEYFRRRRQPYGAIRN